MNEGLQNLIKSSLKDQNVRVVGIDPGETTGICCFEGCDILDATQIVAKNSPTVGANEIKAYIEKWKPSFVVLEDYKVYSWKSEDHSWASLHTPRLIGALDYICNELGIPVTKQMAQAAKGFCTDDKLKLWGLWIPGKRHARDAIRHTVYFLLFHVAKAQILKHKQKQGGNNQLGDCT